MTDEYSALREEIGLAILGRFQKTLENHGIDYDPDTCYEAADEVMALLASKLLGLPVTAEFGRLIGPATFRVGETV